MDTTTALLKSASLFCYLYHKTSWRHQFFNVETIIFSYPRRPAISIFLSISHLSNPQAACMDHSQHVTPSNDFAAAWRFSLALGGSSQEYSLV